MELEDLAREIEWLDPEKLKSLVANLQKGTKFDLLYTLKKDPDIDDSR